MQVNLLLLKRCNSVLCRPHKTFCATKKKVTMGSSINEKICERLSPLVRPAHYNLVLRPDLKTGLFTGTVNIDINVREERKSLNLHTNFLDITNVKVSNALQDVAVHKYIEVKQIEQLLIQLENPISSGEYKITLDFNGDLTKSFVGFYLSRLTNDRTMVASKFQPTYARQAFPCFDEPDFKATFDITLVKPQNYVALSNMNEVSKLLDPGTNLESVTFATSVPMSTYLACFVVCDFDHKETTVKSNGIGKDFTLRSYAQRDETHKIDFAQDIGKRATEFYIRYYEVPFPLPKLDMIAIPDYVSGATEHWGLITYRETSFLVDQATASAKNKIAVANTIAHELAHMWFGNLVTMKWWDDLWLNEGFASYMQVKALNAIEPSWTMLDQFLTKTMHSVLVTDAKLSSHPIVQTVNTPDEITAIFDVISYNKGSSILRMLEGFTGEENFRRGVSDYLKEHKFGSTVTQDLLTSLEPYFKKENPELNVTYILDTWTRQMGYPLLTVSKGKEINTYEVKQSRFLLDPEAKYPNDSKFKYRWFVPITYKTNIETNQKTLWFPDTADSVTISLRDGEKWLKINNNQVGYYRVNYPTEMWEQLTDQLKSKSEKLTISDRAHLLDEIFALAEASAVSYDLALNLSSYLSEEKDYVPWTTAADVFASLALKLRNTPAYDHLQRFVQRLVSPLFATMSWEKTDIGVIDSLLRTQILSLAARSELPRAEAKVKSLFSSWLDGKDGATAVEIETDLRDFVYFYGMKTASQSDWDRLWAVYRKEEDAQEKTKLRTALAAPRDGNILQRYLDLAWDESNIRSQDYLNVVSVISSNPAGAELVWARVREDWPRLVERFSLNSRYLGQIVPAVTKSFSTELKLAEMEAFFAKYPEAGAGEAARRRALESVRNNIKWRNSFLPIVSRWLETHQEV